MRARRLLTVLASLLLAGSIQAPAALAGSCALSAGNLGISVGDGDSVTLVNDGTSIDVVGQSDCSTPISQVTSGISISGTAGDNRVEVRLHPTVAYPIISLSLIGGTNEVLVTGSTAADNLNIGARFSGPSSVSTFTVDGLGGDDVLNASGWAGAVTLLGGYGDDTLIGSPFGDALDGGPNDDTISGRGGRDRLEGGLGVGDAADYAASTGRVVVTVNGGSSSNTGGDATGDSLSGFEDLIGSAYGDILIGDAGSNALLGNSGDDLLMGRAGADLLAGGLGVDTASYVGSPSAVQVALGLGATGGDATGDQISGAENVTGSSFADRITGDSLANRLDGGPGGDTLLAGAGDDSLSGGPGNDFLDGGLGSDLVTYRGAKGPVVVDLVTLRAVGDGVDTLKNIEKATGSRRSDTLIGDARANVLSGGGGSDTISGNGGNDRLLGEAGGDRLSGGAGTDALDGGEGTDACDGGPDPDTYKACDGSGTE